MHLRSPETLWSSQAGLKTGSNSNCADVIKPPDTLIFLVQLQPQSLRLLITLTRCSQVRYVPAALKAISPVKAEVALPHAAFVRLVQS